ncbi:hypothetical protein Tco_0864240, partial [Tanacetum coccineum]
YKDGKVRSKCENKGIVPTEMELVLEYTQQGASHEVSDTYPILLSFTHCGNKSILRVLRIILVILPEHPSETMVFHNEDGNPARANIKQALGYLKDGDGDGNSQHLRYQLNFEGQPMPLLAAMLSQAGEGAGVAAPAVPQVIPDPIPESMPKTDQPQDHVTAPPRQQLSDPVAPVFEHGQSSDPDIASFSQVQETNDAPSTSTYVEDEPLGGSFHASPPRSTPASPAVYSLETDLKAHKHLFKVVVGKLVKQVKAMEVKLKTKKKKVVVSDSDIEDGGEQDVDLEALHALANAAVTVDSTKSPGGPSSNPAACSYDPTTDVPTDVPSGVAPSGPSTVSPGSTNVPTITLFRC